MWFPTPNASARFGEHWRTLGIREGVPSQTVNCLLRKPRTSLDRYANGLAYQFTAKSRSRPPSLRTCTNNTGNRRRSYRLALDLQRKSSSDAVKREIHPPCSRTGSGCREYGSQTVFMARKESSGQQSVFADPHGKIWFAMNKRVISVADLRVPFRFRTRQLFHIEEITYDGIPSAWGPVHLAGTHRRLSLRLLRIESLRYRSSQIQVPNSRCRRRWRLPLREREVNKAIGSAIYRFRLLASNRGRIMEQPESEFDSNPAVFWQTWWFRLYGVICSSGRT